MNSFAELVKELNNKDCPKFIVLEETVILNLDNVTEILPDIKRNYKETKDDLFIEILFGEEHEKLYGLRVSQILEAIKLVKEKKMIVCDICRNPSRGSKIIVESQTPNNAPCLRNLQPMDKGNMVVRINYQIDICPECLQKLLVDNGLPPLYYEVKEKVDG